MISSDPFYRVVDSFPRSNSLACALTCYPLTKMKNIPADRPPFSESDTSMCFKFRTSYTAHFYASISQSKSTCTTWHTHHTEFWGKVRLLDWTGGDILFGVHKRGIYIIYIVNESGKYQRQRNSLIVSYT